jgi:hypothetical protein
MVVGSAAAAEPPALRNRRHDTGIGLAPAELPPLHDLDWQQGNSGIFP